MDIIARTQSQLGAAIRRNRKQQSLTQGALAARMNTRQATISMLERGDAALGTVIDALAALNLELVVRARSQTSLNEFLRETA